MKLDRNLNLVIPIVREDCTIYVHSTPISRECFESYHSSLAKAFSDLTDGGMNLVAGLATARLALRDAAINKGVWEGETGVKNGLMNEIRRISSLVAPGQAGWDTVPLQTAINKQLLDEDELSEVENSIIFFTLACRLFRKHQVPMMLEAIQNVGGLQITSLNSTEYRDSLQTSTETETLPTVEPSSIPV